MSRLLLAAWVDAASPPEAIAARAKPLRPLVLILVLVLPLDLPPKPFYRIGQGTASTLGRLRPAWTLGRRRIGLTARAKRKKVARKASSNIHRYPTLANRSPAPPEGRELLPR